MLQQLHIRNYAIISEVKIDFSKGMNVITGETGAGKSILMGALGLILGQRADSSVLLNADNKCVVEGYFRSGGRKEISAFLTRQELDSDDILLIRREISSAGKSRAFINDTPVNLSQLQELSSMLVDLHQQFDTLSLSEVSFQREVLDALAGQQAVYEKLQQQYDSWQGFQKKLGVLQEQKAEFEKQADYNQFQYDELAEANFQPNELEEAEQSLELLTHAEAIKSTLEKAAFVLVEDEQPVVQQLKTLVQQLQPFSELHTALPGLLERLRSAQIELQDIADELDHVNGQVQFEPDKLERLNERLSLGYRLEKKHGVQSTEELLTIQSSLAEKLDAVLQSAEELERLTKASAQAEQQALETARKLQAGRKKVIGSLEKSVDQLLKQVGMPNARIKVSIKEQPLTRSGIDDVEFLFDANNSGQFQPVKKVASGGELSRLMLCIKSLVAASIDLPTMIFDEIDTGISGEAARQVGIILKELATSRQVICITHQPQIAGKGDAHFFVYKEKKQGNLQTHIRPLSREERVRAIAEMLGGDKPSAAALQNAEEMVERK